MCSIQPDKMIFVTKGEDILTNYDADHDDLSFCYQEEADIRIFVHIKSATKKGCKSPLIINADTGAVVLAVFFIKDTTR